MADFVFECVDRPFPEPAKPRSRGPRKLRRFVCANCDATFDSRYWTCYCGPSCRSIAKLVRYARGVTARFGSEVPDDIDLALRKKFALAISGGYDQTARRLSPARRAEVRKRDQERCVLCGGPGEEIDHIAGPIARLSNLRLLCPSCHDEVTLSHLAPIADEATARLRDEVLRRWHADQPERVCDTADWEKQWRVWAQAHGVVPSDCESLAGG